MLISSVRPPKSAQCTFSYIGCPPHTGVLLVLILADISSADVLANGTRPALGSNNGGFTGPPHKSASFISRPPNTTFPDLTPADIPCTLSVNPVFKNRNTKVGFSFHFAVFS